MTIIQDWFFLDVEEMSHDKDKYEGLDTVVSIPTYDTEAMMVPAEGLQLESDQYIVCPDGEDVRWVDDFDDLIKTR